VTGEQSEGNTGLTSALPAYMPVLWCFQKEKNSSIEENILKE
jgi:hypothetical protein